MPSTRTNAQTPRIVVVQEKQGTGCLPVIIGVVLILLAIILLYVIFVIGGCSLALSRYAQEERGKVAQSSAPTAAPVASPKNEPAKPTAVPVATPQASPVVAPATPHPTPPKSPLARWEVFKKVDEMTDATTYLFTLDGERVDINDFVSYTPKLVIRITPQSVLCGVPKYSQDVAIMIETEGFHREVQEVTIRVDSLEPVTGNLQTSTSRRAVFLPEGALKSLDGSKRLALRFTTTLGAVRTLKFNLEGFKLDDLETELIKRVRVDRPKGVEIAP